MRTLTLLFTVTLLSGCQARALFQNDLQDDLESTIDQDYLNNLKWQLDQMVKDLKESRVGRELDTLVQDSLAELGTYRDDAHAGLTPYARQLSQRLGKDLQRLVQRLRDHLAEGRLQADRYGEELRAVVEQNAQDVRARASAYGRKLRKRLQKDAQDIQRKVSDYLDDVRSRAANNMEDVKTRLDPFLSRVRDNARAKVSSLRDLLESQVDEVTVGIRTAAEDIRDRMEDSARDLKSSYEDKMEEVRVWFQPLVLFFTGAQ